MAVAESRISAWVAPPGHTPGRRAAPALRPGVERVDLVSARDVPYVMFRSPGDDGAGPHHLRLTPDEATLAEFMDGGRTVAQLVSEFARLSGRLAPDQVGRLVADLAANRMLAEPPGGAGPARPAPAPPLLRGRRIVLGDAGRLVSALYRAGGRWLFNPVAAGVVGMFAAVGLALFAWTWWQGGESVFWAGGPDGSYAAGALLLLVLLLAGTAVHELGHALAARHAGRRASAAGVLLQYGVPAVFVDTSDVWSAPRRARLLTTLAGPLAALALAGFAQVVGLFFAPAAGPAFKLGFVVYASTLVALNPLLPLDGHYLLADLLEVPNLRSRALAWLRARVRVHRPMPPLDGEGRLIALYGGAAVLWSAVTAALVWRIWADRVGGAVAGARTTGWVDRVLLAVAVLALAAPLLFGLAGWLVGLVRRLASRRAPRDGGPADRARRLAVLKASPLGHLPPPALADLAARSSWLRPRRGERIVRAGAVQPHVLVVADGVLEARVPGDPSASVRQRVGPGGVIGLAGALTGAPSPLAWHTAGTTLLAVPAPAVFSAVGPLPGPSPADRAEVEELFADTPALEALPAEDRMALAVVALPHDLRPGEPVHLRRRNSAVVVGAGVIVLPEGTALPRGTMIGPVDAELTEPVAFARTDVRLWTLPPVAQLPTLLGGAGATAAGHAAVVGGHPRAGAHPIDHYPPLVPPPGPPEGGDDHLDRRLERGMWGLVGALGLVAALTLAGLALPGPAWAELPGDRVLLTAERGPVVAVAAAGTDRLTADDRTYLATGDRVEVGGGALARLTFRGGSTVVLCPGSRASIVALSVTAGRRPIGLTARLGLGRGRLLADTATPSRSYDPLALTVDSEGRSVASAGSAWYVVGAGEATVSSGQVRRDGVPLAMTSSPLTCGDGVAVPRPAGTPEEPTPPPAALPTAGSPSPSPTASAEPDRTATPAPTDDPTPTSRTPGGQPPPEDPPPVDPPPVDPPPVNEPPTITWVVAPGGTLAQQGGPEHCGAGSATVPVAVSVDDDGGADALTVTLSWSGFEVGSSALGGGASRSGTVGPVAYPGVDNGGGTLTVEVSASDGEFIRRVTGAVEVAACQPPAPEA